MNTVLIKVTHFCVIPFEIQNESENVFYEREICILVMEMFHHKTSEKQGTYSGTECQIDLPFSPEICHFFSACHLISHPY